MLVQISTCQTLDSVYLIGANLNEDDTFTLNRDTANNEIDIYDISSHKGLKGELDTRLLTEDGQKQIKDDLITSSAITNAIEQIATSDRAGVLDFFTETEKNVKVYERMKKELANNPELTQQLSDPNLTPQDKQAMLQNIANTVAISLGYKTNDVNLISTDETGKNDTQVKGHYNSGETFVNDKNNQNTNELVSTTGHETQHSMDAQHNQNNPTNQLPTDENYNNNFGDDVSFYTSNALDYTNGSSFASTNNHNSGQVTTTPSVFNTLDRNNAEFAGVDKSLGEDRKIEKITYYGKEKGNFVSLEQYVEVSYETTIPEMFSRALEYPEFREKVKTEALNAASVGVAVGGGFATGGTAWLLWGVGATLDGYSVYQNKDLSYGLGSLATPNRGKIGTAWSVGNAINNSYVRDGE